MLWQVCPSKIESKTVKFIGYRTDPHFVISGNYMVIGESASCSNPKMATNVAVEGKRVCPTWPLDPPLPYSKLCNL